jgi:hypothetical protein
MWAASPARRTVPERQAIGVDVAGEPAPHRGLGGQVLVLAELELPAAVAADAVGVDAEPLAFEAVAEAGGQGGGVGEVAQQGVDDQPVTPRGERGHRRAEGGAREAAAAVAADQPGGAQAQGFAVGPAGGEDDVIGAGVDVDDVEAELEPDLRVTTQAVAEDLLEGRLVEEARAAVTVGAVALADPVDQELLAAFVDDLGLAEFAGVRPQLGEQPGRLEIAQGLLVDVGGPRDRVDRRLALADDDPQAETSEQVGQDGPGRAAAEDRDVERRCGHSEEK